MAEAGSASISPIVLAMLAQHGGPGTDGLLTDPSVAAAIPRLSLAQSMMQEGMNTSAAYPMQALARLVQGAVGGMTYDKALKGIGASYLSTARAAAGTLPDSPLKTALMSENPAVAYRALDSLKTAYEKLAEPQKLDPLQHLVPSGTGGPQVASDAPKSRQGALAADINATPASDPNKGLLTSILTKEASDNGVLFGPDGARAIPNAGTAAGTVAGDKAVAQTPADAAHGAAIIKAETEPKAVQERRILEETTPAAAAKEKAVERAKNAPLIDRAVGIATGENPALIDRAGGIAKVEAPFRQVGTGVQEGPDGAQREIPISAATMAAMNGNAGAPPAQVAPGGLVPALQPDPAAGANAPPAPVSTQATTTPTPALQPSPAPGGVPPIMGKALPNAAIQPAVEQDSKEVGEDRNKAILSQENRQNLQAIRDLRQKVGTGWSAEQRLQAARVLKALGVNDTTLDKTLSMDPAAGQLLEKNFLNLSAQAVRTMGAREPGSVISMFSKAYPNIGTDPDAVNLQTNILRLNSFRNEAMANEKTRYFNESVNGVQGTGKYRGLTGFNEQFEKTHNPEDYIHAAEAMSGKKFNPWTSIKDPAKQHAIVSLIPSGESFIDPDGKISVKR